MLYGAFLLQLTKHTAMMENRIVARKFLQWSTVHSSDILHAISVSFQPHSLYALCTISGHCKVEDHELPLHDLACLTRRAGLTHAAVSWVNIKSFLKVQPTVLHINYTLRLTAFTTYRILQIFQGNFHKFSTAQLLIHASILMQNTVKFEHQTVQP